LKNLANEFEEKPFMPLTMSGERELGDLFDTLDDDEDQ